MTNAASADTIDLVELGRAVRRGWRQLIGVTLACVVIAGVIVLWGPRWFNGTGSVVIRSSAAGSSLLSKLSLPSGSGDQGGGGISSGLDALAPQPIETEIQILQSRSLLEQVVDSLGLQISVRASQGIPAKGIPTDVLFSRVDFPGSFTLLKYHVERVDASTYRLTGKDTSVVLTPGKPARLPTGTVTLRAGAPLPPAFDLVVRDHEDAITRAKKNLTVAKAGGEVVRITYQAADSITAAAATNALTEFYLRLRHTKDRGINQHRVEFLDAQLDTVSRGLRLAEDELRRYRESSGVVEPEPYAKLQFERVGEVRKDLGAVDVERGALDQLLTQINAGRTSPRELAVYPSFLKSPAINDLLSRLVSLETQRTLLLQRRRESDDSVMALGHSITDIERQLTTLGGSYSSSLKRQHVDLTAQLDTVTTLLSGFPSTVQSIVRLQRHMLELVQEHTGLQVALVTARLAAIGEGGDARQLDPAIPMKQVAFPKPALTLGVGLGAGLFLGVILAMFAGLMGRWMDDPIMIERAMGVPALRFESGVPLLMSGQPLSNTMLLVPLDGRTNTAGVADRLARTALARALEPTVLDLTHRQLTSGNGAGVTPGSALAHDVAATIRRLEGEFSTVIVRLPALASDEAAAALNSERPVLLVAPPGRVDRHTLFGAIQTLRRLEVPCAGVVVNRATDVAAS